MPAGGRASVSVQVYREAVVPPVERCFKLSVRPVAWKARLWRAFDDTATVMLRLDAALHLGDIAARPLRDLLEPFTPALASLAIYLERGARAPLPLAWSVGWLSADREHAVAFLHRVVDDPFGNELATLFRAGDARADVTLSMAPYELSADRVVFAVRDYDIGTGADFAR